MGSEAEFISLVRRLVEAENEGGEAGKGKADSILARDFTVLSRSSGDEIDRDSLLKAIAHPRDPNPLREFDEREFWVRESGDLAVVRSVIAAKKRSQPKAILGTFRNTHVFAKQQGLWRLPDAFSWQGKAVLVSIGLLICAGWFLAGGLEKFFF